MTPPEHRATSLALLALWPAPAALECSKPAHSLHRPATHYKTNERVPRSAAMSDDLSPEEIHDAVDRAVAELLDDAGVTAPPVDTLALAQRHLGLVVRLKPDLTPEQRQYAVAQEIGRVGRDDLLERLGLDPQERRPGLQGASLVNLFADRLLLPTPWFRDEARASGFDLLALKEVFATASHEAIAWRMLDLDDPSVITVVDNGSV